ncbi:MAG: HAMP domain-containing protein [Candidatus Coatesbacteria bacterium]|nr:MAG: HAMP domain-containing protein [Candidatus Coatesbacteria bacterium]
MFRTLKFKIGLLAVLLVVVVTAVSVFLISDRMQDALRREIELRGETLARDLAAVVEDPLTTGDDLYIARFVTEAAKNEGVLYAVVLDDEGVVRGFRDKFTEDFTRYLGKRYEPPPGVESLGDRDLYSQTFEHDTAGSAYDVAVAVKLAGKKKVGEIHVGISQAGVIAAVNRTRATIAVIFAGGLVMGVIGSLILSTFLTRPIDRLMRGVKTLQKGDFSVRVPVKSRDEIGQLTGAFNEMAQSLGEKEMIKDAFSRYVSRQVAEIIVNDPDKYVSTLKGERKRVAILFADIRGFSAIAESLPPEEVVALLNDYLTEMTDVIFEYEGTLDKFLGDGLMAIFGAPVELAENTLSAVKAAVDMRDRLEEFNADRKARGEDPIRVGIGINFGEAIVGNVGSRERMDYTVIGDTVNVAQRLQAFSKGGQIILSEMAYGEVKNEINAKTMGEFQPKGRGESLVVYEVEGVA